MLELSDDLSSNHLIMVDMNRLIPYLVYLMILHFE